VVSTRTKPTGPASLSRALAPVATALLALLGAAQATRLWDWRPGQPFGLGGDATFVTAQLGRLVGTDSLRDTTRLGAPFGQTPGWFPSDDQIHFLFVTIIGLFTDSPYTAGGIYFILGFPASALTAFWLMRQFGSGRLGALVGGVLFALLPGHQSKYEHLWLAGYWVLPLALWIVVSVAMGRPLFHRLRSESGHRWKGILLNARTVACALCVAIGDIYYLAFFLILLFLVAAFRYTRDRRQVLGQVLPLVVGVCVVAGTAVLSSQRGKSADLITGQTPAVRGAAESEIFSGRLIDLVLPWYYHRWEPLRLLTTAYNSGDNNSVEHPALGIVALAGVVGVMGIALACLLRRQWVGTTLAGVLAGLTLISLAFYTTGGLGSVVAVFATPQIRTWSRLYLVIGLIGLWLVSSWLTTVRRRKPALGLGVALVVLLVGVLDQTSPEAAPDYAANASAVSQTRAFTTTLEDRLPSGCSVFQLPVVQFPESPSPGEMKDYDHLLPFLTSTTLKWSYGAMRGTAKADWQLGLDVANIDELTDDLAAAGFCAVEVDRQGYAPAKDPTSTLGQALGEPLSSRRDGRLVAWDLQERRAQLVARDGDVDTRARGTEVLHPLVAQVGGLPPFESDGRIVNGLGPRAEVTLSNMTGSVVVGAVLTLNLTNPSSRAWELSVTPSGGSPQRLSVPAHQTVPTQVVVDVPVGRSSVVLASDPFTARRILDGSLVSGQLSDVTLTTSTPDVRAVVAPRVPFTN
jgi:hypothetical protein